MMRAVMLTVVYGECSSCLASFMFSVVRLSVIKVTVVMLSVITLVVVKVNVAAPWQHEASIPGKCDGHVFEAFSWF